MFTTIYVYIAYSPHLALQSTLAGKSTLTFTRPVTAFAIKTLIISIISSDNLLEKVLISRKALVDTLLKSNTNFTRLGIGKTLYSSYFV